MCPSCGKQISWEEALPTDSASTVVDTGSLAGNVAVSGAQIPNSAAQPAFVSTAAAPAAAAAVAAGAAVPVAAGVAAGQTMQTPIVPPAQYVTAGTPVYAVPAQPQRVVQPVQTVPQALGGQYIAVAAPNADGSMPQGTYLYRINNYRDRGPGIGAVFAVLFGGLLLIIMTVVILFYTPGCSTQYNNTIDQINGNTTTQGTSSQSANSSTGSSTTNNSTTGSNTPATSVQASSKYEVTVTNVTTQTSSSTSSTAKPTMIITLTYKNKTTTATSYNATIRARVIQNGQVLNTTTVPTSSSTNSSVKDLSTLVNQNQSITGQIAYTLVDDTSPVSIEFYDSSAGSNALPLYIKSFTPTKTTIQ
ncbi:MAG: DUF5067 domain-containing protein [Coriobacteriales bacterium]|nr:DUF5067 domain-containing protein [Coriobacteriales bacterium]